MKLFIILLLISARAIGQEEKIDIRACDSICSKQVQPYIMTTTKSSVKISTDDEGIYFELEHLFEDDVKYITIQYKRSGKGKFKRYSLYLPLDYKDKASLFLGTLRTRFQSPT